MSEETATELKAAMRSECEVVAADIERVMAAYYARMDPTQSPRSCGSCGVMDIPIDEALPGAPRASDVGVESFREVRLDDPILTSLLYTATAGAVLTSVLVPWFWEWPTATDWVLLMGTGLAGGLRAGPRRRDKVCPGTADGREAGDASGCLVRAGASGANSQPMVAGLEDSVWTGLCSA